MEQLIWLLPVIFIFHDFEEIIFMHVWIEKNKGALLQQYPVLGKRMLAVTGSLSTEGFAFCVFLLFVMLCIVSIFVSLTGYYIVWISAFMILYLHFFMHIGQAVILWKYVPALITSIICIIPCTAIFIKVYPMFSVSEIIISLIIAIVAGLILFIPIIKFVHIFDKWILKLNN